MIGESGRFGQLDAPMSVAIPEAARCGVSYTVPRRCAAASEQKRADPRVPGWSRPRREAGRADCLGVFEPGNQHRVAAGIGHSSCVFVRRPSMGRYVKSHRGPCGGGQPPQRSIVRSDALTLGESSGRASGIRSDQSRLGNSMNNDVPLVRCWWWTTIPTCVSPPDRGYAASRSPCSPPAIHHPLRLRPQLPKSPVVHAIGRDGARFTVIRARRAAS